MQKPIRVFSFIALALSPFLLGLQAPQSSEPQQPAGSDWYIKLQTPGRPVYLALPEFEVRGTASAEAAKVLTTVAWSDLEFASVYRLVPKERFKIITSPTLPNQIDYYQWESIGADILVLGAAEIQMDKLVAEVRIYSTQAQQMVFGNRYEGRPDSARAMAHRISDDILLQAGNYRGVARTKLAFTSDRRGEQSKELYIMDYDGYSQKPLTANRSLNLTPTWSPDGKAIAYTSYRNGRPDLYRAFIYEGRGDHLVAGPGMSFTPAWSPDGKRLAFTSTKDGNSEIYLINADGTGLERLTNHRSIDTSPCWSQNGREIAFTSDRTGAPQIYVMGVDGLNVRRISFDGSYNDAPAWSPSREFSEITWASRIERGPFDIVVYNLQTQQVRQLTTGRGSNESPNWSPNGLHLVFSSDRTGSTQVYSMNRDGTNVRRLTSEGNNTTPKWGPSPGGQP